jgi:uncharacterized SAM-binding protein YcdF (DUF218 family)
MEHRGGSIAVSGWQQDCSAYSAGESMQHQSAPLSTVPEAVPASRAAVSTDAFPGGAVPATGLQKKTYWQPLRWLLTRLGQGWIVDDPLAPADAIVVLGGDSVDGERVRHAVQLHREGWAPRVVVSGPYLRPHLSEAGLMAQEARSLGLPAEALLVARHRAGGTLEEALVLREFFAEHNLRRIIIATSDFHTRHARAAFRAVFGRNGTRILLSAASSGRFNVERWWKERVGLSTLAQRLVGHAPATRGGVSVIRGEGKRSPHRWPPTPGFLGFAP